MTYFHSANLLNVGHTFRCLALLLICPVMMLNMLMHNNVTGHSNGKLWNLNAEEIFLKSQGLTELITYSNSRTKITLSQRFTLNA